MNRLRTIYLSLLFILAMNMTSVLSVKAENYPYRSDYLWLTVPDHADWLYKTGEQAKVEVSFYKYGIPRDGEVNYEIGDDMLKADKKGSFKLKNGRAIVNMGTRKTPGFRDLRLFYKLDGKTYQHHIKVGFSVDKIQPYTQEPKDFDAFWKKALDEARQNDLNPTKVLLPERCTKDKNVYEISYNNNRWGSKMYGILSVPVKEGKYPALLRVPGAGVRPYAGDTYTAPAECIVLEIGIHGVPVTMQQKIYDDLANGELKGYWDTNLENPYRNAYRRVVTGAVRGVDYIASLPEWNGKTIGVTGSSQGGFLSIAVAALDKRITFLAPVHDAMCDYEAEIHGVAGGWPHYFYKEDKAQGAAWKEQKLTDLEKARLEGARYYDGVNFARRITVPGWYSFGYNDEVVPPTSSYGLYNSVKAPKTLSLYQMTGHYWYQEQWDEWQAWIIQQLKK